MMGRQTGDQSQLFYVFNLEERIPDRHLLRRINPIVTGVPGRFARSWDLSTARSAGLRSIPSSCCGC
jgi:hypothetical protein